MMQQALLESFIERIEQVRTLDDLESEVFRMRDQSGLQHLLYHWINAKGELFGAGTYSTSWRDHYIGNDYARIDPVVKGAFQRFHPLDWARLDWNAKPVARFKDEARDAGISSNGLTVPIRGPSGQFAHFSATLEGTEQEWIQFSEENARPLILLGHYVNQKALEISNGEEEAPGAGLSPREVDSLTYLAMGYNRAQAAETLCISEHTLRVYIESARHKLRAMNTTHAIAKALKLGLLVI